LKFTKKEGNWNFSSCGIGHYLGPKKSTGPKSRLGSGRKSRWLGAG